MPIRRRICPACKKAGLTASLKLIYTCVYCNFTASPTDEHAVQLILAANTAPLSDKRVVFTSEDAWDYLVQTAKRYNYVRGERLPHGMFRFVAALADLAYVDTRPTNLQSTDQWSTGLQRYRRRKMILPGHVLASLRSIADEHRITPFRYQTAILDGYTNRAPAHINDAPIYVDQIPFASAVLEAIGLRYLSPATPPGIPTLAVGPWRGPPRRGTRTFHAY